MEQPGSVQGAKGTKGVQDPPVELGDPREQSAQGKSGSANVIFDLIIVTGISSARIGTSTITNTIPLPD